MTPIAALKAAIRTILVADGALTALLEGAKVYDDVPRSAEAPYIAFAEASTREHGTATDKGHISELTLHVWSRQGGSSEGLAIASRLETLLDDAPLVLAGHHLVSGRVLATETRRLADRNLTRVALRLRFVTEVL
ncbi:MAG: DUF3168 domain-containing protein [Proteobacteria bacterium]|nr:DUF3168 domain-containing protein [Pseudomonadota bacterium]